MIIKISKETGIENRKITEKTKESKSWLFESTEQNWQTFRLNSNKNNNNNKRLK